jgi:peroxiredoxin
VVVWGVTSSEAETTVSSFVDAMGVTYPVLLDSDNKVIDAYALVSRFPTTVYPQDWIIDQEGKVAGSLNSSAGRLLYLGKCL